MQIRLYTQADRAACVKLFESNMPAFFAPHELADFTEFLDQETATNPYFVVEDADEIVACGGVWFDPERKVGGMCWGMVTYERHRQGIGWQLLQARIALLRERIPGGLLMLDTSQHSAPFFARAGFVTTKITTAAYAPDLDRYDMVLDLKEQQA